MDIEKDLLEKDVLFWVEEVHTINQRTELWGSAIACSHGLGAEDARSFHGDLAFLTLFDHQRRKEMTLSRAHRSRHGFYWDLSGEDRNNLPPPPFLVTSNMDLRFVRSEEVYFYPVQQWASLYAKDGRIEVFHIWCDEYFGILIVDKVRSIKQGTLLVFSDQDKVQIEPLNKLFLAVNPDEEFGTVEVVDKKS